VDQLEDLVQACIDPPTDAYHLARLTDWLEGQGDRVAARQRLAGRRWPGQEEGGSRWYWWRATMRWESAAPSATLSADIYDRLPQGPDKGPEVSLYKSPLEAFRALLVAIRGA
jgi:hypothetical protein